MEQVYEDKCLLFRYVFKANTRQVIKLTRRIYVKANDSINLIKFKVDSISS